MLYIHSVMSYFLCCAGGEATGNSTFGLSSETPVVLNGNCSGTEYYLQECDGYSIEESTSDYCLSGQYQAGVRCIEGLLAIYRIAGTFGEEFSLVIWQFWGKPPI